MAKLTEEIVGEIRRRYRWHERGNSKALAAEYGVAQSTILATVSRKAKIKTWKHLSG